MSLPRERMDDGADHELRGRDRLQRAVRPNHDVSQLARAITADSLADRARCLAGRQISAKRAEERCRRRPNRSLFSGSSFRPPANAAGAADGRASSSNRVGEPALQADRFVVAPARIERDLFDDVWRKVVRADRCAVQQATGVTVRGRIHEEPGRHRQSGIRRRQSRLSADPRRTDRRARRQHRYRSTRNWSSAIQPKHRTRRSWPTSCT